MAFKTNKAGWAVLRVCVNYEWVRRVRQAQPRPKLLLFHVWHAVFVGVRVEMTEVLFFLVG